MGQTYPLGETWFAIRFKSDGSLDTGFGTGGKTAVNAGLNGYVDRVDLQTNGKIILSGRTPSGDNVFARLNTDGSVAVSGNDKALPGHKMVSI